MMTYTTYENDACTSPIGACGRYRALAQPTAYGIAARVIAVPALALLVYAAQILNNINSFPFIG